MPCSLFILLRMMKGLPFKPADKVPLPNDPMMRLFSQQRVRQKAFGLMRLQRQNGGVGGSAGPVKPVDAVKSGVDGDYLSSTDLDGTEPGMLRIIKHGVTIRNFPLSDGFGGDGSSGDQRGDQLMPCQDCIAAPSALPVIRRLLTPRPFGRSQAVGS